MASVSRKSRNYKEKKSMLTFGYLVLPLVALIAVALLFVGIKLFFLSPVEKKGEVDIRTMTKVSEDLNIVSDEQRVLVSKDSKSEVRKDIPKTEGHTDKTKQEVKNKTKTKEKIKLAGPISPESLKTKSDKEGNVANVKKEKKPIKTNDGAETRKDIKSETGKETVIAKESKEPKVKPKENAKHLEADKKQTEQKTNSQEKQNKVTEKPVEKKTPSKETSAQSKWAVQIGAFVNADSAAELAEQVKKQGYTPTISKGEASGKEYHRVRVGSSASREDAAKLASELEGKGYPVSVVLIH